jgi:hypothetical protein
MNTAISHQIYERRERGEKEEATRLSRRLCDLSLDDLHNAGVSERAQITKLVAFARDNLAHDAAHDLRKGERVSQAALNSKKQIWIITFPERVFGRSLTM